MLLSTDGLWFWKLPDVEEGLRSAVAISGRGTSVIHAALGEYMLESFGFHISDPAQIRVRRRALSLFVAEEGHTRLLPRINRAPIFCDDRVAGAARSRMENAAEEKRDQKCRSWARSSSGTR